MKIELTTDSPCSHYGIPSLQIDGVDYGPADRVDTDELVCESAAQLVCDLARDGQVDIEEAKAFCSQWPDAPQIA